MFTAADYRIISDIVFQDNYCGYRPTVVESPDGDGKWDDEKRYAHVADKYLKEWMGKQPRGTSHETYIRHQASILGDYLHRANERAIEIAIELGVPKEFWPVEKYGALRILEYPPGAVTNSHVDFDLFTLMCYRNIADDFHYIDWSDHLLEANKLNQQIHFGEILGLVVPGYKATRHEVIADPAERAQYSMVYFAIPDWEAELPDGQTVGKWLEERLERSRKETK